MILKPSLSFAGPREYRWQGLEVPVMMGKRRGTAQITTASLGVCAASYRHKNPNLSIPGITRDVHGPPEQCS